MSPHSRLACALCALGLRIFAGTAIADSGGSAYTASSKSSDGGWTTSAHGGAGIRPAHGKLGYRLPVRWGMKGSDVRGLQHLLSHVGIPVSGDGSFGHRTRMAVIEFERRTKRPVNGILDRGDLETLYGIDAKGGFPPPPAPKPLPAGSRAKVNRDGLASVGVDAPQVVKDIIAAGNRIARTRYVYGGGHRRWEDRGYDCSGSVSYALHGAGLLAAPLDSTGLGLWGGAGAGRWITIYANAAHAYAVIAGLRFDTSGARAAGTRWQAAPRRSRGFIVRHPLGL